MTTVPAADALSPGLPLAGLPDRGDGRPAVRLRLGGHRRRQAVL